jgi:D-alanyl-D-alanine carboxypeptidase
MSRRPTQTLLAIITALGLLAAAPLSASAAPGLQQDVNQLQAAGPSSVVAQTNNRGTVTNAVAGTAQLGTNLPVSPNTHYRTGSVTKTFVSATILQLVGEGRLSLDDTVDRWLPGLITGNGNDGTKITVRQLLQHTSGLFEFVEDQRFLDTIITPQGFYAHRYDHYTPQQLIEYALSHQPNFAPGTAWSYSNTNYLVAGLVIKAVTGNTWDIEVTNRIVKPLGLTGTSIPGDVPTLPAPFAHAYNLWSPGVYSDTTEDNMTWADSAGAIITTTGDENKFFSALLSGKVLKAAQLKAMQTTVPISMKTGYGLGIAHSKLCNTDVWWHDGGTVGYGTFVATTPTGSLSLAFDVSTTDITDADPTFDGHVNGAQDALIRHAFCGTATTSTDSLSQESAVVHGRTPIK